MRGRFRFHFPGRRPITVWNTIVQEGQSAILAYLFQNVTADWPAGGANFYIGLANQAANKTLTLAGITTEPGAAGGYARQAAARNAVDWPTLVIDNNAYVVRSKLLTFAAVGADFDTPFTRAFLCDVASGSAGNLYAVSGALTEEVTVTDTNNFQLEYELFIVAP